MKKIIAVIASLTLGFCVANAQDLQSITEMYNTAASSISVNKTSALSTFEQVYGLATALGEEGAEIAEQCKGIIPSLYLAIAKDLVGESNYEGAIAQLNKAIEIAAKYENAEVAAEAKDLVPQVLMQSAGTLLNAKKYAEAAAIYKQVVDADATNGVAALRLGLALNGAGDLAGAKAAFAQAAANGQAETANKQLGNIHLKAAAAALKAKKYADAVSEALSCAEMTQNATAYQIAAQASQASGKNADAIKYFEKYLELSPKAKNATQVAYTIAVLYQQSKNNAKAKEYYQKAVTDPNYGAAAKKMLETL